MSWGRSIRYQFPVWHSSLGRRKRPQDKKRTYTSSSEEERTVGGIDFLGPQGELIGRIKGQEYPGGCPDAYGLVG